MDKNVNSKKISICIPTWEQHGKGVSFLEQLFVSIESQTYKNYNSKNATTENLSDSFHKWYMDANSNSKILEDLNPQRYCGILGVEFFELILFEASYCFSE